MGRIGCLEISVKNYDHTLRNSPEERSSYLFRGGSLKTGTPPPFYNTFWGIFDVPDVSGDDFCVSTDITLPSSLHEFGLRGKLRFRLVLGAQISIAKSPRRLDFVRWNLIFVNPQY